MAKDEKKKLNPRQQRFVDYYCSGMTAKDAYVKAGYKSKTPGEDSYKLRNIPNVAELIEIKKAKYSQSIDDKLAFEEENTFDKLFEVRDLPLDKETFFAVIKACTELIDRKRGKASQNVNLGGQEDNPIKIEFEYFDTPKESEDVDDDAETIPE